MWPFKTPTVATDPAFDGKYLSWQDERDRFVSLDLSVASMVSGHGRLSFVHVDGQPVFIPMPIGDLRSIWVIARTATHPIPRQF